MLQRTGQVIDAKTQQPLPGATVFVYNLDGTYATLTSDGTTALVQPLTVDEFGGYSYYADVGYYREDTWYGGKRRWSEDNIAIGNPGADLSLRADLISAGGTSLIGPGQLREVSLYIDHNGTYADRSAKITIDRDTVDPNGIVPTFWSVHSGNGDNATFRGVSNGYLKAYDRAGITSAQRGVLYGLQISVGPRYSRDNAPYDDATALVLTNEGLGTATEAIYAGLSGRPAFAGTGYVSAGTLTITSVTSGTLVVGTILSGTDIPANAEIASGPDAGGVGTYTMNSSFTAGSSGSPIAITGLTRDFQAIVGGKANAIVWAYAIGDYDYVVDCCFGGTIANIRQAVVRAPNAAKIAVYRNAAGTADLTALIGASDDSLTLGDASAPHIDVQTLLKANGGLSVTANSLGYGTGVGGTVAQATNKSTAVTLNKACGQITLNNAALAANTAVSFTFNNGVIGADDDVRVWVKSGNATVGTYRVAAEGNGAGSRSVVVENKSSGSLSEAIVLGFNVIKAVIA